MTKNSYQFIHIDSYARVGSNQKTTKKNKPVEIKKRSVQEIINEAVREKNSCPHIENPQKPTILFGCDPNKIVEIVEDWAAQNTDAIGRKMRKDGLCMVAGVASLPREMEENFSDFAKDTVNFLQKKYGERLKSVVQHDDEAHPHLHFYVVPNHGEKFEAIHEGYKASAEMKAKKEKKGAQNLAYIEAMRAFQNDFSEKVGVRHGLLRLGPGKRRLTRSEWKKEKQQAANIKEIIEKKDKFELELQSIEEDIDKINGFSYKMSTVLTGFVKGVKDTSKYQEIKQEYSRLTMTLKKIQQKTKKYIEKLKEAEEDRREAILEKQKLEEENQHQKNIIRNYEQAEAAKNKKILEYEEYFKKIHKNLKSKENKM